ncbi:GH25 family lysozyme [Sedimentitalea sp. HM32M-2]|uniref:glycoside hydrolase family 25 protein n=1 Tax=Sedimentitalea sp. HM32M-2 TaxID=3351566 RepID=UPI0036456454
MRRIWVGSILAAGLIAACGAPAPTPDKRAAAPARTTAATSSLVTYPKFGDSDPHPWKGRAPGSYPIHGIDVARYQGDIDWRRARNAGVSFAYVKATEGGDFLDPMFRDHWRGARRAGVRRGAYHYYYFCRPAEEQARWFIRNVPRVADALPHVLDMEWNPHSPTCRLRPDGAKVRAEAERFLSILQAHYGRRPVLYTTVDFFRETDIGRLKNTEFWLRSVAGHPRQVYPGAFWTFWQYTGTGIVPGVNGPVDLNVFRASPEIWLRWADGG